MIIQIATFARIPEQIINIERKYRTEELYLVVSTENFEKPDKLYKDALKKVEEFYKQLGIVPKIVPVDFNNFPHMLIKLGLLMQKFSNKNNLLLNLSGGRRSTAFALMSAAILVGRSQNRNIKCCFIAEYSNKGGESLSSDIVEFDLLPSYLPDEKDIIILNEIKNGKKLVDIAQQVEIAQPTVSLRLGILSENGYLVSQGRKRKLTEMGEITLRILGVRRNQGDINE